MTDIKHTINKSGETVFISYTDNDENWVQDILIRRLKESNIKIIHKENFRPGGLRLKEQDEAVKNSFCTILVLSSAYLKNAWASYESILVQTLGLDEQERLVIPVIREPIDNLPPRLKMLVSVDLSNDDEKSWVRLISYLQQKTHLENQIKPKEYVLVADDEKDVRDNVRSLLEQNGFLFEGASNTEELLKALNSKRIKIIIADLAMRGQDGSFYKAAGIENLRVRNHLYPNIPVIIFSDFAEFFADDIKTFKVKYWVGKTEDSSQDKLLMLIQQAWVEADELNIRIELDPSKYRETIRKGLGLHFEKPELIEIMFDIGFDPTDIADKTKDEIIKELITRSETKSKIVVLIHKICQLRPSIGWYIN